MSRWAVPIEAPELPAAPAAPEAGSLALFGLSGWPHSRSADGELRPMGGEPAVAVVADEALTARSVIRVYDDGGVIRAELASAAAGGARGNAFATAAIAQGATGKALAGGFLTGFSGLTPRATYYMATTPGGITLTPASNAGALIHRVGRAATASVMQIGFSTWPILTVQA